MPAKLSKASKARKADAQGKRHAAARSRSGEVVLVCRFGLCFF
jgi:hypothetical protein